MSVIMERIPVLLAAEGARELDFGQDILPIIFSLGAIVLVLYLSYAVSKWLGKNMGRTANSKSIRIVEKAAFSQNEGMAIVQVCETYYLVGFSNSRVEILQELPDYSDKTSIPGGNPSFQSAFLKNLTAKLNPKAGESHEKTND